MKANIRARMEAPMSNMANPSIYNQQCGNKEKNLITVVKKKLREAHVIATMFAPRDKNEDMNQNIMEPSPRGTMRSFERRCKML